MSLTRFAVDEDLAADSTELWAFAVGIVRFSELQQRLIREIPVDDSEYYETSELKEHAAEQAEIIWQNLERRQVMTGSGYPFLLSRDTLRLRSDWASRSAYILIVLLVHYDDTDISVARVEFEFLTGRAIAALFDCEWIRFGANRQAPVPSSLRKAVDYVTDQLQEGGKSKAKGHFPSNGDFGCDIIAWHSFHDNCKAKLIVIGQCATAPNWKALSKHTESHRKLRDKTDGEWFSPMIKVFSTPFIKFSDLDLSDIAEANGILLNRWRIARLAVGSRRNAIVWLRRNKGYALNAPLRFWS